MKLDEFHVLQRQTGAQHHRVAVAGAGVRRGAGLVDPAAAAGRDDGHVGAESMDRSVLETPGEQAAAGAVLVHQQVDCEILDEEARLVLQALLVERVQDRVAGAVRRGAGTIGHVALGIFRRVAAEAPLVDLAGLGAAERHAEMLEFDDRVDRLAAHIGDRVLVAEPVRTPDRIEHVPAPIVLFHIAERGADAALRGDRMAARRKDLGDAGRVQAGRDHAEGGSQSGAAGAEYDDVEGMVDDLVSFGHHWLLVTEKQFEDGEDARASEDHHGCADEEASRNQPGARMHIVENNGPQADQRVREPGKHEQHHQQRGNWRGEPGSRRDVVRLGQPEYGGGEIETERDQRDRGQALQPPFAQAVAGAAELADVTEHGLVAQRGCIC